ncbi:helix-turn-helix domain-containing protein [Nonomuraea sp. B10E15]|uniref:MarR family winged helix-turn-helix transcriptional regulator n=1 Tax=Nonomuraea sp. B10E15 TaxID=3153560 RepID=UPI00325DAAAB
MVMNTARLRRLGRRLVELSMSTGDEGEPMFTPGEEAVFEDVLRHPGSTVGEIHARTGFAQSHVSASVARMRERDLLATEPDPDDGRRTRVRVPDTTVQALFRRATTPVAEVVRRAVPDGEDAERAVSLLTQLEALLVTDGSHGRD